MTSVCEWLNRIKRLDSLIDKKIEQRARLMDVATGVTSQWDGMPHGFGVTPKKVEDAVARMAALDDEINALIDVFVDHKRAVMRVLNQLPEKEKRVMYSRYFDYKSWVQIGVEMHYTPQHVWRINCKAIRKIQDIGKFS